MSRRGTGWLVGVIVLLGLLWVGYWYAAHYAAETAIARAGVRGVGCSGGDLTGFPLQLDLHCAKPSTPARTMRRPAPSPASPPTRLSISRARSKAKHRAPLTLSIPGRNLAVTANWTAGSATGGAGLFRPQLGERRLHHAESREHGRPADRDGGAPTPSAAQSPPRRQPLLQPHKQHPAPPGDANRRGCLPAARPRPRGHRPQRRRARPRPAARDSCLAPRRARTQHQQTAPRSPGCDHRRKRHPVAVEGGAAQRPRSCSVTTASIPSPIWSRRCTPAPRKNTPSPSRASPA